MADFNWVKARAECSEQLLFARLMLAVRSDVDEVNRVYGERQTPAGCQFVEQKNNCAVLRTGRASGVEQVIFRLSAGAIHAEGPGERTLRAIPSLNPVGDCKLEVDGRELELWQFCRLALEPLFFPS